MTRREEIVECLDGIENGHIKLQEHVQTYGSSEASELLAWLGVGVTLILGKELKSSKTKEQN